MIAQKLLGQDLAAAAVAIDAAQIKGDAAAAAVRAARDAAGVQEPGQQAQGGDADVGAVPLRLRQRAERGGIRRAVPALDDTRARARPLFEAAAANFNPHASTKVDTRNSSRGPLLLISGGKDHTVPESVVRATLAQYRHSEAVTDLIDFPDRGHSLTIDSGWPAGRGHRAGLAATAVAVAMDLRLAGKTAVVTGASRGIGLAVTRALIGEGVRVVAAARESSDELRELGAVPVVTDLTAPDGPAAVIEAAARRSAGWTSWSTTSARSGRAPAASRRSRRRTGSRRWPSTSSPPCT